MKNFKSTEWLRENIDREDLVVLDARAELSDDKAGYEQYKAGHIKGAHYVSLEDVLTGEIREHGGRHPLPDLDDFIQNMMSIGVEDSSTVIIYDNGDLAMAGRLWWLLKYIGLDQVYILEGGYRAWVDSNNEVTKVLPKRVEASKLSLNIQDHMLAEIDEVKEAKDNKDIAIIDSRAFERYSGEVEPLDKIPGHIPSAINYPWLDLAGENKKDIEELKEYFKDLDEFKELIVHCGSGVTGTVNILFMEEIALKAKLYAGGYSDWVSYKGNEVISKNGQGVKIK